MFKENRKNIVSIICAVLYTVKLILNIDFQLPFVQNFRYIINSLVIDIMPLITPVLCLVFLFSLNKEYKFKRWLLPIAFGVNAINVFLSLCGSFSVIGLLQHLAAGYIEILFCRCLILVSIIFIFIGTLSNFKYSSFIKYGTLCCAVLNFFILTIEFISIGGFKYLQSVPMGVPAVNLIPLITFLTSVLFYIGIFILTINKKEN